MTIQTNIVTINGTQYKHTYSTTGYMITRNDNKQFVEAYDPTNSSYTYTESATLALQSLGARLSALETSHDALEALPHIIETGTSDDGLSWYKLYSDKCCIQHGRTARGTITLLKSYKDTNYSVVINGIGGSSNSANTNVSWVTGLVNVGSKTTTSFSFNSQGYGVPNNCNWITIGYIN